MKNKPIFKQATLGMIMLTGHIHCATIIASDFTDITRSGTVASAIDWTTTGLSTPPPPSLTVTNTIQSSGSGNLFTTAATEGVIAPANNTSNGGQWNVQSVFTVGSDPIELNDFDLTYLHFSGTGGNQNAPRDANYTVEILDSLGVIISTETINTSDINTSTDGPQTINFDLTGVTLDANSVFTLFVQAADADGPAGNNTGFDAFALNGTIVPEPSSAILLGLGGLALGLRRRR